MTNDVRLRLFLRLKVNTCGIPVFLEHITLRIQTKTSIFHVSDWTDLAPE